MTSKTPNAKTASFQVLYDFVFDKIMEQGKPSISIRKTDEDGYQFQCEYISNDGCRCAVGHLMPNTKKFLESERLKECQGYGAWHRPVQKVLFDRVVDRYSAEMTDETFVKEQIERVGFIDDLQSAHDSAVKIGGKTGKVNVKLFLKTFQKHMNTLAYDHKLEAHVA